MPPAIRISPLFSIVALWAKRGAFRLPVTSKPAVTVNVVEALIVPEAAWMVADPSPADEAIPEALTVATPVEDELHFTELVTFCVLLSVKVPVAVNCCVLPRVTDGAAGVTSTETSAGALTVKAVAP